MRADWVDAATFRATAWPVLMRDEIANNLMFSVLGAIERGAVERWRLAVVREGDAVVAAATQGDPYSLICTPCGGEALDALADLVSGEGLRGVQSAGEGAAEALARAIAVRSRQSVAPGMLDVVYRLDGPPARPTVSGQLQRAEPSNLGLLHDWGVRFCRDCALPDRDSDVRARNESAVKRGTAFLWLDEHGHPAAMAFQAGDTPNAGRVGMVYVPDERRGRGYGRAVTAALSAKIIDGGKPTCCLLADSANAMSNRAYVSVGYRPVARFDEWLFESP